MTVDSARVRSCLAVAQEHLDDPLIAHKVEQLMVAVMMTHSDDVASFEEELAWLDDFGDEPDGCDDEEDEDLDDADDEGECFDL
jgi:hypothetical protein